jgi:hypothetical protein
MIRELCIGEYGKESGRGLLLGTIPTSVERLSKNQEDISEDIRSLGRDFNPQSPEYEKGAVTTQLRCSVIKFCFELL